MGCFSLYQEKGGIFSGMFKKSPKPVDTAPTDKVICQKNEFN